MGSTSFKRQVVIKRLDALFEIERGINGKTAAERRAVRQEKSKPLFDELHAWLLRERETLSRSSEVLKPMNYMLSRWDDFARFLDDGRICLTNNAAERALRGVAVGRRNWTFAGSERGAQRCAVMLTMTASSAIGEIGLPFPPSRAFFSMSASSKNPLRAWAMQKAGVSGRSFRRSSNNGLRPL